MADSAGILLFMRTREIFVKMRKLRVGVWLRETYNPTDGGGYGYYSELIDCISKTKFFNADICYLGKHTLEQGRIGYYKYYTIKTQQQRMEFISRCIKILGTRVLQISFIQNYFYTREKKQNESLYCELHNICDIIYYPVPMCQYPNYPFVYTLWDLGHLSSYAFPEVNDNGRFEDRKHHHDQIPFKALMVFCESETGKSDAVKYLQINEKRLKVLPLFSSGVVSENLIPVRPQIIHQDWDFIHYPAQYWAHKNHYNLISAFRLVAGSHPKVKLILTGSDHGNKSYVLNAIRENNLEDRVIELGFVSFAELKWLYLHSKGLIMPTLMGPTNMPPLEALALGCPVAVSDLPGHREQLGNNAIYFNPLDIEDIRKAIEILITRDIVQSPVLIPTIKQNMRLLDAYFAELKIIRQTWN